MNVETLTKEEVLRIHERLVEDFAESDDPIAPAGVMSEALLESALGRQYVAMGGQLKYPAVHENAATLLYGLCMDHPFHNGNKRTALVAMLAHLDKNKMGLYGINQGGVNQKELFDMIIAVATHSFGVRNDPRRKDLSPEKQTADEEVSRIADWIAERAWKIERGERRITYRDLRRLLKQFDYFLDDPDGNAIDIVKLESERKGIFRTPTAVKKRINNIPYPGENKIVPLSVLKDVRRICRLREEDGVDSVSFYDQDAILDGFINEYRTVLRRLARR